MRWDETNQFIPWNDLDFTGRIIILTQIDQSSKTTLLFTLKANRSMSETTIDTKKFFNTCMKNKNRQYIHSSKNKQTNATYFIYSLKNIYEAREKKI